MLRVLMGPTIELSSLIFYGMQWQNVGYRLDIISASHERGLYLMSK